MTESLDYQSWKKELLAWIDASANTTEKGNRFVQRIMRDRYQLSEDDAVNATDCAGAGDHGVDAIYIEEADNGTPPRALAVQGKYGAAELVFSPYNEFTKFQKGLIHAIEGSPPTNAIQQCASVWKQGGEIRYIVATVDPLSPSLRHDLENIRTIAHLQFEDRLFVDAVSLLELFEDVVDRHKKGDKVKMACQNVQSRPGLFIGAASLVDVHRMLRDYAGLHNGVLDGIYDRNVRKWLGKRGRSVNAGIAQTLKEDPGSFVAYNNGVTIVCLGFTHADGKLAIDSPQVVNGCQTTRTLYDFMENQFAGLAGQLDVAPQAEPYRDALLPFKLIAVDDLDGDKVKNITRYSNRQNAVRGKDFLTLESVFQQLKKQLMDQKYYLEVQTGEYDVLPKAVREKFPRSHLINAFDALRFYGAGVMGKPHVAFGHSGDFTPGGKEFDLLISDLRPDDLLVPWLIAQQATELGYSLGAKHGSGAGDDHRSQTRYFFLYVFFRVANEVLSNSATMDMTSRSTLYDKILKLHRIHSTDETKSTPLRELLDAADTVVATYMTLAKQQGWYDDRNSFLKRDELLKQTRLVPAVIPSMMRRKEMQARAKVCLAVCPYRSATLLPGNMGRCTVVP